MKIKSLFIVLFGLAASGASASDVIRTDIAPGIYRLTIGTPEPFSPYALNGVVPRTEELAKSEPAPLPFDLDAIIMDVGARGCSVAIPLNEKEQLYGFGLQIGSYEQRGLRKRPVVNDYPLNNLGYTHAPQPFYVSTEGYGIIVNTARYTTFYCGSNQLKGTDRTVASSNRIATTTEELYRNRASGNYVFVDIPNTEGVEIFVITGKNIREVVERYNLLSGGGCLPPMWGLGLKYRTKGDFNAGQVKAMADYFRNSRIPCDVLGLEPGWQTAYYSCSYVWNKDRFPDPDGMTKELLEDGFRVNLWEHAYVHPTSPVYASMYDYASDFLVWKGLVPDFTLPEARKAFGDYHGKLADCGISGFKLDECDNSNIATGNSTWGFPDMAAFPSGIDGEQMHQVFGSLYLRTMDSIYRERNLRAYQDYRSSGLFMSSVPATLYSDTYDHEQYIQMVCNSAFGGLLWSPELRESNSEEEFFHRLQTVLLSAQAVVNSWYLQNPPWLQYDRDKNNNGEMLPHAAELETATRKLVEMRMSLIPYLYSAFRQYYLQGTPPFRPLVMDYPEDGAVQSIDDQYLIGESLLAAPLYGSGDSRKVYFPQGRWYNLYTDECYEGGQTYEISTPYDQLPVYVKENTILPLAEPVQHVSDDTVFRITCRIYGTPVEAVSLFEDDGVSYDFEHGAYNRVLLDLKGRKGIVRRDGNYKPRRYEIIDWKFYRNK